MRRVYLLTRMANFDNEIDYVDLVFSDKEKAEKYLLNNGAKLERHKYKNKSYSYYSIKNEYNTYTTNYLIIEKEVVE